jgi:hypothetical protein
MYIIKDIIKAHSIVPVVIPVISPKIYGGLTEDDDQQGTED